MNDDADQFMCRTYIVFTVTTRATFVCYDEYTRSKVKCIYTVDQKIVILIAIVCHLKHKMPKIIPHTPKTLLQRKQLSHQLLTGTKRSTRIPYNAICMNIQTYTYVFADVRVFALSHFVGKQTISILQFLKYCEQQPSLNIYCY